MVNLVYDNSHKALNRAFGVKEFGEELEKALERETKDQQKKSFAPSSLGYNGSCPRYWYYAFNGAEFAYDTDGPAMANMNAGTDSGKRLAELLDKAGMLVDSEVKVNHTDPPIFGYIDAMVRWKGEVIVSEIKTTSDATWNYRVASDSVPGYQFAQLLIYMYVTKKDKGFFLTENKNTNKIFIHPVKMTDENKQLVEDIFDWMRAVKKNAEEGELPKRPFTRKSFACKGCPVQNTCWDGWERTNVAEGRGKDPNPGTVDLPPLELPKAG